MSRLKLFGVIVVVFLLNACGSPDNNDLATGQAWLSTVDR